MQDSKPLDSCFTQPNITERTAAPLHPFQHRPQESLDFHPGQAVSDKARGPPNGVASGKIGSWDFHLKIDTSAHTHHPPLSVAATSPPPCDNEMPWPSSLGWSQRKPGGESGLRPLLSSNEVSPTQWEQWGAVITCHPPTRPGC